MKPLRTCTLALLAFTAQLLAAQDASPLLVVPAAPPALLPPAPRAISPEAAAKLAALAPKFSVADTPVPNPAARERDPDRPRNTIIRLPNYIVTEPKIKMPKQREMLTPKGRLELALKRYPGLRFGNIGFLRNDGIALMMYEEDLRLERMREMADLLSLLPASLQANPEVKHSAQEIFIRPTTPRTTGSRTMGGK